jgi:CRISPR/Cas system-associated exonuclease Cas4 (RecB family)
MASDEMAKEDLMVFSPTSLTVYQKCPRKYYLAKIAKAKPLPKDKTGAEFGKCGHSILEKFESNFNIDELIAVNDVSRYFHALLEKMISENWDFKIQNQWNTNDKLKNEMKEILNVYIEDRIVVFNERAAQNKLDTYFPIAVEEDIRSEKFNIRCIIDKHNANHTLLDYKFSKYFPEILLKQYSALTPTEKAEYDKTKLQYEIQALMNALVVYDKYNVLPAKMTFFFPRFMKSAHHGIYVVEITQQRINWIANLINQAAEKVRSNNFQKTEDKSVCAEYGGCEYMHYCDFSEICIMSL